MDPVSPTGLCASVLAALLTLGACGPPRTPAQPYRYRSPLLSDLHDDPLLQGGSGRSGAAARSTDAPAGDDRWRPAVARRCRAQVGKRLRGKGRAGQARLARRCLGRTLPEGALRGDGVPVSKKSPKIGDLVLFNNTDDRNGNGRPDDLFTDAGVVVDRRGSRVSFVYLRRGRVRLGALDLRRPHLRRTADGTVRNTYLRVIRPGEPRTTPYLAAELLAGFATVTGRP